MEKHNIPTAKYIEVTSYEEAVKALEIKEGEFEKTSTMKIKRYKEISRNIL